MSHPTRDPAAFAAAVRAELSRDRANSARGRKPAPPAKPLHPKAQAWAASLAASRAARLARDPLIGGAAAGTAAAALTFAACKIIGA